jgi:3-hydroxybutyryl-CoA dehydrogenase
MTLDVPAAPAAENIGSAAVEIGRVGVIGAGQMGNGIAHVAALAGLDVVMLDSSADALVRAKATIEKNLERQVSRKLVSAEDSGAALSRIGTSTDYAAFAEVDLVIEAATEREEVKHAIFQAALPHIRPAALLASNTSSIPITRLAARTDRPEKFIGMHFMNPVPVMKLVEIIRGIATDEPTFQAVQALAHRMGKTTAVAQDFPAFIVNRVLIPMINEAVVALQEGVGSIEAIDASMKLGANHPMGPFELGDFIGLDTCLAIMRVIHEGLGDSKYRPSPLLVKYVEAGWLGRKTGRGFYDYSQTPPRPTR